MPDIAEARRGGWRRRILIVTLAVAAVLALALAVLGGFPWGALRGTAEKQLSEKLGRPVVIGSITRVDIWSLHPTLAIRGVHVRQPAWAGSGDAIAIREARLRFPVLPLLLGRLRPDSVAIDGMRLALVRDAAGRESWSGAPRQDDGGRPALRRLTIRDARVSYRDARRDRAFVAALAVDGRGLTLTGRGRIHAAPVALVVRGGAIDGAGPWPFSVAITGDAVGMTLAGRADAPLDLGHFSAAATAHGDDLKLVDAIIEAGLPATQPVGFTADVRHDAPSWTITNLKGTIGRSDIAGRGTVGRRDGRHRIDAVLTADRFDFDDLSSDEGQRKAAARRAALGPRLVPDTAIDLRNVARTDGTLRLSVHHLLWPGSSPFRSLSGTIGIDHRLLTAGPLALGLPSGTMTGSAVVDQRGQGPVLTLDLDLDRGRLTDFFPGAAVEGSLQGRIRLTGPGRTIRAAIGRSSGSVAFVARDGQIPARTASLLGEDVGHALTTGKGDRALLRCAIARLDVRDGTARPAPLLIDTSRALTRATGSIDLAGERLALALSGAPKRDSLLRLAGAVTVAGTIKAPDIRVPAKAKSVGGVLRMLGKAIAGEQAPTATDVDCDALARAALR